MLSKWNAKADTVSTVVLWLGSLVAALICIFWLVQNLSPDHVTLQHLDNELTDLQRDLNTACRMETYWKNYFPKVNEGTLIINDLQVCIDSGSCSVVYYESNETEPIFDDPDIILNNSFGCGNIMGCNKMYYSGDLAPVFTENSIILYNATTCENENTPIIRCRLLMCSLNESRYLDLDDMIYTNITKDANDTFTFEAH